MGSNKNKTIFQDFKIQKFEKQKKKSCSDVVESYVYHKFGVNVFDSFRGNELYGRRTKDARATTLDMLIQSDLRTEPGVQISCHFFLANRGELITNISCCLFKVPL